MKRRTLLGLLATPILGVLPRPPWPPPEPALGEPIVWVNPEVWMLRVTDDPTYHFGFSGFKEGDAGTIVGQVVWKGVLKPRLTRQIYGIGE